MEEKIIYLTVTAINKYIESKYKYDPYLKEVYIQGEISNCKLHSNGNFYFSIKDNESKIDAIKFNGVDCANFKEGDKVYLKSSLNFFYKSGQQRLYVSEIKQDSIGDLYKQFENLKEKLYKQGYFSDENKKQIPRYPNKIAIITSSTGAAIQDIKRTIRRRYPIAKIILYPSLVQGEMAVNDIIKNLKLADKEYNDVIILARGGGSIEDLWCFNNEYLVKEIFNCKTPIVTGVGHETDTTLVDYVSDKRASTPTAAAEIVTYYTINEIKENISLLNNKLKILFNNNFKNKSKELEILKNNHNIKNFIKIYDYNKNKLENYKKTLNYKINNKINISNTNLFINKNKYKDIEPLRFFIDKFVDTTKNLENNSPISILNKGYSLIFKEDKKVSSVLEIEKNDKIKIKITDGTINASVLSIEKERL